MKPQPKPSDYATRKEYRWAKKAQAKEQSAAIKPFIYLALIPLVSVWIASGSFALGLLAAALVPLLLFALVVVVARLKGP